MPNEKNIVICYNKKWVTFAHLLRFHLRKQSAAKTIVAAYEVREARAGVEGSTLNAAPQLAFVIVTDQSEKESLQESIAALVGTQTCIIHVLPSEAVTDPLAAGGTINVPLTPEEHVPAIAEKVKHLVCGSGMLPDDGLPIGYPFAYEKTIIDEYLNGEGVPSPASLSVGCPLQWPTARIVKGAVTTENPLKKDAIGAYRDTEASVAVDARMHPGPRDQETLETAAAREYLGTQMKMLKVLEAGPRPKLTYGEREGLLGIGVLVSGGIAPGINAVIESIVSRHIAYQEAEKTKRYKIKILGYSEGFRALLDDGANYTLLTSRNGRKLVEAATEQAGSILSTARADGLLSQDLLAKRDAVRTIVERVWHDGVRILYIIGGDGSMRAAHAIHLAAEQSGRPLVVVGIPKSTDNDILWVWQSFGFMSSVEWARVAIRNLHAELSSNPRLGIIQLFGSDSGFVASHAGSSSLCDLVLIPEVPFDMGFVSRYLFGKLTARHQRDPDVQHNPYALVVMAETAVPQDVLNYVEEPHVGLSETEKAAIQQFIADGRRVNGQTPDALRTASLKVVSQVLRRNIQSEGGYWGNFRIVTNEPRHLIRSIAPSVSDVVFAGRLGTLAVDSAMAGYSDVMISQWLTEFVLVPLQLVVLGRKRVPATGMFWKSVLARTGQPNILTETPGTSPRVFLCYNSADRALVREIASQLVQKNIPIWLDQWSIETGVTWQSVLEDEISRVDVAAVFFGASGIGAMQQLEIQALISEFVKRKCKLIPVILSNAPRDTNLPLFMQQFHGVDTRSVDAPIAAIVEAILSTLGQKGQAQSA